MDGRQRLTERGRARGFTLIEQLVAIAIAAILACMATPSLQGLLERQQLAAAQSGLIGMLAYAREAAIRKGVRTVLCPSLDGLRCSGGNRWEAGWILGYDRDHDEQPDPPLLRTGRAAGSRLTLQSTSGRSFVRFLADGSAGGSNLTFTLCLAGHPQAAWVVAVALSGRIRGAPASEEQATACSESQPQSQVRH